VFVQVFYLCHTSCWSRKKKNKKIFFANLTPNKTMNNTAQTKPTKTPKIDLLQHIIETAGGKVDKNSDPRLVEKPGVMLLSESRTTSEAQQLFRSLNINQNQLEYLQIGEF
jgi:hypothetical protein